MPMISQLLKSLLVDFHFDLDILLDITEVTNVISDIRGKHLHCRSVRGLRVCVFVGVNFKFLSSVVFEVGNGQTHTNTPDTL